MGQLPYSFHALKSHKATEYQLRRFTHIWDSTLQSPAAKAISVHTTEAPPASQTDPLHEQHPDTIILEANKSFLKSLKSLRETNQSYLDILQQESGKPVILPPSHEVASKLPPTPPIPQINPRRSHHTRDGKENSNPRQSPDVAGCVDELSSMGLTGS